MQAAPRCLHRPAENLLPRGRRQRSHTISVLRSVRSSTSLPRESDITVVSSSDPESPSLGSHSGLGLVRYLSFLMLSTNLDVRLTAMLGFIVRRQHPRLMQIDLLCTDGTEDLLVLWLHERENEQFV